MKKLFVLMFLMIFLVGTVSAWEWDNVKDYDKETKTITVTNALGLGDIIAEIQLNTPLNYEVGTGYQKVAEFEVRSNSDYSNAFKELELFDKKDNDKKFLRDYDFKALSYEDVEINNYGNVFVGNSLNGTAMYERQVIGTHIETKEKWTKLTPADFKKDDIVTIGIFTEVKVGDYVEWIPNFFGIRIDEWATWTSSLNVGLEVYYNFDETTGTVLDEEVNHVKNGTNINMDNSNWVTGILGNALNFSGVDELVNITDATTIYDSNLSTVSFWIYPSINYTTTQDIWNSNIPGGYLIVQEAWDIRVASASQTFSGGSSVGRNQVDPWWSLNQWHHIVIVANGSGTNQFWADGINRQNSSDIWSANDATYIHIGARNTLSNFFGGRLDEMGIWNRTLSGAEVVQLYNGGTGITFTANPNDPPEPTLISPEDGLNIASQIIDFSCNATDDFGLKNITLEIDGVANFTNETGYYVFDGVSDYVTIATNNSLSPTDKVSVVAWVKTNGAIGAINWIYDRFESVDGFGLSLDSSGNPEFGLNGGSAKATSSVDIDDGDWHSVIGTYDKDAGGTDEIKIYVDSVLRGTGDYDLAINYSPNPRNQIGRIGTSLHLNGSLDEVRIYNKSLSPTEVTNLYNQGRQEIIGSVAIPNLVSYWNLGSNATTDLSDGNDGTNNGATPTIFLNQTIGSLSEGTHNWTCEACNNVSLCTTATTRTFTIDTTPPNVDAISPNGTIDSIIIGENLTATWLVTESGQNLTEHISECLITYGATIINVTEQCVTTNSTNITYVNGINNYTIKVTDKFGLFATNTTSWEIVFIETGVDFKTNVTETSNQSFEINLSTGVNVLSISAILTYNGTNHTSDASCIGGDCIISNLIDIPLVVGVETVLDDFSWTLSIFNGTSSSSIVTSTRQQNVTRLRLEPCAGVFATETLNFTIYDEQTLESINPYLFAGAFDFWTGSGTVKRNNSISETSIDVDLCIRPINETMMVDAIIDYDENTNFTNYTNRFYYFDNKVINNVSEDIFMYLLNSDSSTSFILKVQDESLLPVQDALIEIHRYYPGTDSFRIVQIAKTDDNGKSIGFFQTETVDYKFIIKKDGVTLLETGQQKVVPETSPFTLTFNTGDPLGSPWDSQEGLGDLNSTLVWDDGTGIVTYIYIDTSDDFDFSRLLVVKESLVNSSDDTEICNENSSLTSATLTCVVGSTDGFYISSAFITRNSVELLDMQFSFQVETLSGVVGILGLFYGWFLVLIASFMFKFN